VSAPRAEELASEFLFQTRHDPYSYVRGAYPWGVEGTMLEKFEGPREWQADELQGLGEHLRSERTRFTPYRSSVASGHGIGKSAMMAWLMEWGIGTFPEARGRITANTETQLRTITWPELHKWHAMNATREFFKLDGTVLRSANPSYHDTWRMDATPWSEHNPDSFHGLHNLGKRIIVLFDEASGISDIIWEVVEGALTDAGTEIIWVVFGNPTNPIGRFYQTHNLHRDVWRHRQIDSRSVPGTNIDQAEQWIKMYGEDSDFVRVRVKGEFPRSGSNQLIPTQDVLDAQADEDIAPNMYDPLIFGLDVARFGQDQSVLMTRKGQVAGIHGTHKWRGLATTELVDAVIPKIIELRPHHIFVDGGGVGGGVVDLLRHRGFDVIEINFGSKPSNPDYANKRAEMWVRMRDWLAKGASIPWHDVDLFADLTNQTYLFQEGRTNALQLTSKADMARDGLPSPDTADALALTFAHQVAPVVHPSERTVRSSATAETDYDEGWR